MADITVKMKDGSTKHFPPQHRPGGSYENHVSYEGVFVVVTDEWGVKTAIPAADISEVVSRPMRW